MLLLPWFVCKEVVLLDERNCEETSAAYVGSWKVLEGNSEPAKNISNFSFHFKLL